MVRVLALFKCAALLTTTIPCLRSAPLVADPQTFSFVEDSQHISVRESEDDSRGMMARGGGYYGGGAQRGGPSFGIGFDF
jgi:hypothetical protein